VWATSPEWPTACGWVAAVGAPAPGDVVARLTSRVSPRSLGRVAVGSRALVRPNGRRSRWRGLHARPSDSAGPRRTHCALDAEDGTRAVRAYAGSGARANGENNPAGPITIIVRTFLDLRMDDLIRRARWAPAVEARHPTLSLMAKRGKYRRYTCRPAAYRWTPSRWSRSFKVHD